jgi:hypothetical protein
MLATCFDDTKVVIAKAFNHLQAGGWLEFQDPLLVVRSFDSTHEGTAFSQLTMNVNQAGVILKRDFDKAVKYEQWLYEAGFVDVTYHRIPWHVDKKFKENGAATSLDFDAALDGFKKPIQLGSGAAGEEVDKMIAQAKAEFRNREIHMWVKL